VVARHVELRRRTDNDGDVLSTGSRSGRSRPRTPPFVLGEAAMRAHAFNGKRASASAPDRLGRRVLAFWESARRDPARSRSLLALAFAQKQESNGASPQPDKSVLWWSSGSRFRCWDGSRWLGVRAWTLVLADVGSGRT
jgi:hypothetical protein